MSFPCYESYKDSGVEWLNTIPNHWIDLPLKAVASHNNDVLDERTADDYEILYVDISSVNPINGITSKEAMPFSAAPSRARRRVKHGDVIVSTVRTYLRAIARINEPEESLVVSTGFCVVRPSGRVFHGFLGYLLSSSYFVDAVISHSVGVSYPAINASALVGIKVPLPSIPEQQTIATFLDRETAKIDALITEQQRLIELLKEKRQSVISHAVTKGLNPSAPMKDSGIEWLGKVPEHWEVCAIKRMTLLITDGAHISPETGGGVYDFISTKDISDKGIDFEGWLKTTSSSYEYLVRTGCQPICGDILFSKDGTIGRTVVIKDQRDFVVASSLIIIRPDSDILDSSYFNYLCQSSVVVQQVEGFVKGAGLPRLSIQNLLKVFGVFPSFVEQHSIVTFLDRETAKLDTLTAEAKAAITLLQERRTALISAAVTGKIDVRGLVSAKTEVKAETVPC